MAGAPAYRYDYDYAEAWPLRKSSPQVRPVRSRGVVRRLDPRWVIFARVVVTVMLILAVAGVVKITLTNAAVNTSIEYAQVTADMNTARAMGSALEVQASNLSNPAYVKDYAKQHLGMTAPAVIETMRLGEDVVALDESGALSLSQSLAAVARG